MFRSRIERARVCVPDVRGGQRLQLAGQEKLSVSELVLLFLREVGHLRILHLLLQLPWAGQGWKGGRSNVTAGIR